MSSSSRRPRVLLADDDASIRTAVSRLLSFSCDVVGYAVDGQAAVDEAVRLRPDVVLLDLSLPGPSTALELCRRIKARTPEVHVVILTAVDDVLLKRSSSDAGASGFVWKLRAGDELLPTIEALVDQKP